MYDPAVPRFWQVDPLAEKYSFQSVYVYADDNPVFFVDIKGMGTEEQDWIPVKGQPGKWKAQEGDSAASLAKDAGISYQKANNLVQKQLGKNKVVDGKEYSNVKPGDVVDVSGNTNTKAIPINNTKVTEVIDINNDGKLDGGVITTPKGMKLIRVGINQLNKETTIQKIAKKGLQFTVGQLFKLVFKVPSQLIKTTKTNIYEDRIVLKRSLGLHPLASPRSVDSAIITRTINGRIFFSGNIQSRIIDTIDLKPIKP